MSSYVVIGIHGLANKPKEETLKEWWEMALLEGLERNQGRNSGEIDFDLCYWADIRFPQPDDNPEPYVRANGNDPLPKYKDGWFDAVTARIGDLADGPMDWAKRYFGTDNLADAILRKKLPDLAAYYDDESQRKAMRERFTKTVEKHLNKRIMVIAHSMGSIIAYDVLRRMGRQDTSFRVDHLVTIGSPLGLSQVKHRIREENDLVRTPSVVRKWTNYADRRDLVATDSHLADDYAPNDRDVKVRDDRVINSYTNKADGEGDPNYHKSYGYLRTAELSELVRHFI
jgi:hypothetical protein